ncbi:MAG: nucleoside kinase [Ruminococcus sp.]|nr:nucleoside kinase [Ruminococcus sp.]
MNIEVNRINKGICGNPEEYTKQTNEVFLYQLKEIAKKIASNIENRPVILLAGPSGSGKTTTAFMITKLLGELGCGCHTISMDNYFKSLTEEEKELAALGKVDLESPDRIDKELLNRQIEAIEDCQPVEIPKYDFAKSARSEETVHFERKHGDVVIFEGIHALNPDVITVPDSKLCKLYVSVRTRITKEGLVLNPAKIRLMRRMIRDRNFRKRSLEETLKMFHSVEAGENKYIMPYKQRSDYDIDTFMAYEMSVYRYNLLDDLRLMENKDELSDVIEILSALAPLDNEFVPKDSLIREFIGKGEFKY